MTLRELQIAHYKGKILKTLKDLKEENEMAKSLASKKVEETKKVDEILAETKKATKKVPAKKVIVKKVKTEKSETVTGLGDDKYGFRLGTKRSKVMEMIEKGKYTFKEITKTLAPLNSSQIRKIAHIAGKKISIVNGDKLSLAKR